MMKSRSIKILVGILIFVIISILIYNRVNKVMDTTKMNPAEFEKKHSDK